MTNYRAAVCTALNGPGSLEVREKETAPLEAGQVRVAVKAAGLNFPDLLMTYGKYQFRPDPPFVPGLDAAGEVIEIAPGVTKCAIGDRVMAGSKGGALTEQMVTAEQGISPLPEALSFEEGACWQTAAGTAWNGLIERGKLKKDESLLVLGASGGVGMAAVKLGKHVGATVIGTASTHDKREVVRMAGADHVLDPADPDFAAKIKELTDGKGADVVYDPVGGDLAIKATRSIAWAGRYLIIGFASGDIPKFPANHILIKTYTVIGVRAGESPRRDPEMAQRQTKALGKLATQGIMKPHISHHFALSDVGEALRLLEKRQAIGRVVITMD